eukprot:snap_masked-scaffold_2-processed-gene-26.29-mRNA-1 protein AED:0.77 eAED:0.77 QI:0/-1/0/1/-1/1/1/0/612
MSVLPPPTKSLSTIKNFQPNFLAIKIRTTQLFSIFSCLRVESLCLGATWIFFALLEEFVSAENFDAEASIRSALINRNESAFWLSVEAYIKISVTVMVLKLFDALFKSMAKIYAKKDLEEQILTNYLFGSKTRENRYLSHTETFSRINRKNATSIENLLANRVSQFIELILKIIVSVIITVCRIYLYGRKFSSLVDSPLMLVAFIISFSFSAVNVWRERKVTEINNRKLALNTLVTKKIANISSHIEQVLFSRGQHAEKKDVQETLAYISAESWSLLRVSLFPDFLKNFKSWGPILAVYLWFFNDVMKGKIQVVEVFSVLAAVGKITTAFNKLSRLPKLFVNVGKKIDNISNYVEENRGSQYLENPLYIYVTDMRSDEVVFMVRNLSLQRNDLSGLLLENLNFKLIKGDKVLIQGENGCGKTSLFRAFAGILPEKLVNLGSSIHMCGVSFDNDVLFLPQKSFLKTKASLKMQLLYPKEETELSDEELCSIVGKVGLAKILIDPDNKLTKLEMLNIIKEDWHSLSGGQRQILCFARVLVLKPKILLLDEASSALSSHFEDRLYSLIAENEELTYLSIGHRDSLAKYHSKTYKIDEFGHGKLETIENSELTDSI